MTRKRAGAATTVRWQECAAQLAGVLPLNRLHPAVLAWVAEASPRRTWGVALSGGSDSLCLLLLLWAHWPERRARLRALHFNHRLRGVESQRDAAFCRRVCRALGIALAEGAWAEAHAGASEAAARTARHAFFDRQTKVLWCGHQQDDIAETFLMRLARGSGTGGLAAPRPVHLMPQGRVHLRPLLTLRKTAVLAALRQSGAVWREDATNAGGYYLRNRIRRDVLPAWQRAVERDALAGAARTRELLEEDDVAIEAWLQALRPVMADGSLNLRRLAGKPRALVRRALHHWLRSQPRAIEVSRQAFDTLLREALQGRATRQSLGPDAFAVFGQGRLRFVAPGKNRRNSSRRPIDL